MGLFERKILLPQTLAEFDVLCAKLVKKYHLQDPHHAAGILSVAIRHLPIEQSHTTMAYLGSYIRKNLANYVAHHKGEQLRHENQVNQLVMILGSDPTNQQARDELAKAADQGSATAKAALDKIDGPKVQTLALVPKEEPAAENPQPPKPPAQTS